MTPEPRRWCDDCGHRLDSGEDVSVRPTRYGDFISCGPCAAWRGGVS